MPPQDAEAQTNEVYHEKTLLAQAHSAEVKYLKGLLAEERKTTGTLQKEVKRLNSDKHKKQVIKDHLDTVKHLTPAQAKCLLTGQKWARNTTEDIAKFAVLYSISKAAFEYQLRNGALYMASKTTIENWLSRFYVGPGFLDDCIDVASKMRDRTKKPLYNHAMLVFDEVYLKKDAVELDQQTQTIYGPCSKLQVVQIRGLASK